MNRKTMYTVDKSDAKSVWNVLQCALEQNRRQHETHVRGNVLWFISGCFIGAAACLLIMLFTNAGG